MHNGLNVPELRRIARSRGDKTRYAIHKRTGLAQSTIARLLTGQNAPNMTTLTRIAAAYNVPVQDLVVDAAPRSEAA